MLLDTDVILLVSMMRKAKLTAEWGKQTKHLCPSNTRVETFLSEFKLEVAQTCQVLGLLGLVDKCSSGLGYKPTHRLIDIMTDRMIRSEKVSESPLETLDDGFVGLLWRLGTSGRNGRTVDQVRDLCETARIELEGAQERTQERDDYRYNDDDHDDDDDVKHSCFNVLAVLGLLKSVGASQYRPTRLMYNLVTELLERYQ
jgi:hypothetical protein